MTVRVATFNIRNGRAVDPASFWWRRRRALRDVVARIDADVWALQEVYRFQRRHLRHTVLPVDSWGSVGTGRNRNGRGEQVPIFHRRAVFADATASTRWFGPTPELPGSRVRGAPFPRIATLADLTPVGAGPAVRVVNLHLDSDSVERRTGALAQLVEWLAPSAERPTIVMGDFNGPMTDPGYGALADAGLRSALPADAGATSNGFGRDLDGQRQIDHVFVSAHFDVVDARIDTASGHASDHYPVVVDLAFSD
ncbi:MAG: endonuclease/exonuclease/phosphatase family protein [Acidimicrobiales bacterium]